jgi:hypothetical protein
MVAKSSRSRRMCEVRGGVRTRPAMRQASAPGQVEEASGDPFEALAGREARTTSAGRIYSIIGFDTFTVYRHRDLKYPVIVRHP